MAGDARPGLFGASDRSPLGLALGRLLAPLPLRGRGRVARRLFESYAGPPDRAIRVAMHSGHVVELPAGSEQTWQVAYTGAYDRAEIGFLSSLIEPESVVVDIGACFGLYTLPLAEAARARDAGVVAFEPVAANVRWLRANLERNGLDDTVVIEAVALGEVPGEITMNVERGGAGNAVILPDTGMGPPLDAETGPVAMRRLDDVASVRRRDGRCSLIKMDAEGYEMAILRGAEALIEHDRPLVFGEFNRYWLAARQTLPRGPQRWATSHGYDVFAVRPVRQAVWTDRRRVQLHRDPTDEWQGNLLMVPRERGLAP